MSDELRKALDEACEVTTVWWPEPAVPGSKDWQSVGHVYCSDHDRIVAGRDRVIAKLIQQRDAWIGLSFKWDHAEEYQINKALAFENAELIEALNGDT